MRRTRFCVAALTAATVVVTLAPSVGSATAAAQTRRAVPRAEGPGVDRLRADATKGLATAGDGGVLRFAGARGRGRIDNPSVGARTGVEAAARAHLARYGNAFGTDRAGTSLRVRGTTRTAGGEDVVRFAQQVDGVPVLGGEVVVALAAGRDLASVSSTLSAAEEVASPRLSQAQAAEAARVFAARSSGVRTGLDVEARGRAIFDPTVFGEPAREGARSGWQFEVTAPGEVRRLVLVDDQTGAPLLDIDQNQHIDRVVCDSANLRRSTDVPCASGFARTETGPASAVADVNNAFELAGVVSDFYDEVGGLDLTQLLGIPTSAGSPKLAATVRWCYTNPSDSTLPCPYPNAFWNGSQMYYGAGYADADDVVGHEMTHGVIDKYSELFYWGQSGAINESIADVIGEIVDHRHGADDDSSWWLGEDLPADGIPDLPGGAIRSMSDPTLSGADVPEGYAQPDRMLSPLYTSDVDTFYSDNGGVHTNSGVGNKTAYLISQGGSFNGQTIAGIDGSDPGLTKTARLYLDVLEKLASGSDYADLAARLEQSCQDLLASGTAGFTAADCTSVHAATVATELRTTPTNAPQPPDAPQTCPTGTEKAVLFDSETGSSASKFTTGANWRRGASAYWGSNATSGTDSWSNTLPFSDDGMTPVATSLTVASGVHLPPGQPSYLWFQGWHVLDYGPVQGDPTTHYFDAGTVEVVRSDGSVTRADALPWINGPNRTVFAGFDNPASGRKGFGGDSFGWTSSELDLSAFAGQVVRPRFTLNYDSGWTYPGWFLDDIRVYSCFTKVVTMSPPGIGGSAQVGGTLVGSPGTWLPRVDSLTYQWLRDGAPLPGATGTTLAVGVADLHHTYAFRVTATASGLTTGQATSAAVRIAPGLLRAPRPKVKGKAKVKKVLRAVAGAWGPAPVALTYQWLRNGKAIKGATRATYKLTSKDRRKKVSVRVTGRKAGYTTAVVTSARTTKVK
jgi:Zn-dependent metalloprotease